MIQIYTDGATEGRNGKLGSVTHCGIGFYCPQQNYGFSRRIEAISNNEAEFHALIEAMKWAISKGFKDVEFLLDSQLVANKANSLKVKRRSKDKYINPRSLVMDEFQRMVLELKHRFYFCTFTWIPREKNKKADLLSKSCLISNKSNFYER